MDLRTRTFNQMVGKTIVDRYELQELVGSGGMGAVFKGVQRTMNRQVAIKILPKLDPLTAARFHREAKTASRLSHPNTITIFDFGQTAEGFLFIVMEYLVGRSLKPVIVDSGPVPPRRAVHLVGQVCRSLSEAHELGIVHRDVKPDNIFLVHRDDDPDFVKVLDFGIAKVMAGEDSDDDLTQAGRIVGTPRYMAPEQALGLPVDHRADIYSMGVLLYHLLTGTPPFRDSSSAMLMMKHAHEMPESFAERLGPEAASAIPAGLEAVVMKAMSKSPDARQQTVDILRTELELVMPTVSQSYGSMERPAALRPSGRHPAVPSGQYRPAAAAGIPNPAAPSGHHTPMAPSGHHHPISASGHHHRVTPSGQHVRAPSGQHAPATPPDDLRRHNPAFNADPSGSSPSLSHPALVPPPGRPSDSWPVVPRNTPMARPVAPGYAEAQHPDQSADTSAQWPPRRRIAPIVLALAAIVGVIVLLLLGAGGTLAWLELRTPQSQAGPAIEPALAAPSAEPAPKSVATIDIRVSSTPPGAVYAGETRLGMTPMVVEVERGADPVEYEIRADGYQAQRRSFTPKDVPESGVDWAVTLEPVVANRDNDVAEEKKPVEATAAPGASVKPKKERRKTDRGNRKPKASATKEPATKEQPSAKSAGTSDGGGEGDKGAPKSDAPRKKPNVTLLDGGGARKPKVGILGGGGGKKTDDKRKKAKVPALQ